MNDQFYHPGHLPSTITPMISVVATPNTQKESKWQK